MNQNNSDNTDNTETQSIILEYFSMLSRDKSPHTVRAYANSINLFFGIFPTHKDMESIEKLSLKNMRDFQNTLLEKELSNSSVNSHTRNIRAFFNWLVANEYISKSPMENLKDLKVGKRLPEYLTDEEVNKMFKACETLEDKLMFSMLINLGVRRSELINIKCEDIDQFQNIRVCGKGDKERSLYVEDGTFKLLQEYMINHDGEYLFESRVNKGKPISGETVRLKLLGMARRAGFDEERVEMIHPHILRHSCATRLVDEGVDIRVIQEILGHSDIQTSIRYSHVKSSKVQEAMNKRGIGGKP